MGHIKKVNRAEAEFWRRSSGCRVDYSDRVLGFECGGQQWVSEVAFPIGQREHFNGNDLKFMQAILRKIEQEELPAPAPIEQRWTARSSAKMSPAHSLDPSECFSWVGIIMYLPTQEEQQRG